MTFEQKTAEELWVDRDLMEAYGSRIVLGRLEELISYQWQMFMEGIK